MLKTLLTLADLLRRRSLFFVFFFIWVRWTLPRFRYDQLMSLGWKFMLPLALAYIVVIAGVDRSALDARRAFGADSWQFALDLLVRERRAARAVLFGVARSRPHRSAPRTRGSTSAISTSCAR